MRGVKRLLVFATATGLVLVAGFFGLARAFSAPQVPIKNIPVPISSASVSTVFIWNGNLATEQTVSSVADVYGISCPSSTICWATGQSSGSNSALIEWNNGTWETPQIASSTLAFDMISCPSTSLCWMSDGNTSENQGNSIIDWNNGIFGTPQSLVSAGDVGGISCPSASLCWGVGISSSDGAYGIAYDPIPSLSLTWTAPTNSTDADGSLLVTSQQVVEAPYNGSTCGTSWTPITSGLGASATSATVGSPSSSECYSVEAVNRSGSWTSSVGSGVVG